MVGECVAGFVFLSHLTVLSQSIDLVDTVFGLFMNRFSELNWFTETKKSADKPNVT